VPVVKVVTNTVGDGLLAPVTVAGWTTIEAQERMISRQEQFLNLETWPARLTVEQTAWVLNCQVHEIDSCCRAASEAVGESTAERSQVLGHGRRVSVKCAASFGPVVLARAVLLTLSLTVVVPACLTPCCARNKNWSQLSDLNRRPTVYKTVALPLS
jgi:hypothetical protein